MQPTYTAPPLAPAKGEPLYDSSATPTAASAAVKVQSACQNCRAAHLSCHALRPCWRCVATGKEDSCIDVPHKKRGRPRLRDSRGARQGPATQPVLYPATAYSHTSAGASYDDAWSRDVPRRIVPKPEFREAPATLESVRPSTNSAASHYDPAHDNPIAFVSFNGALVLSANDAFERFFVPAGHSSKGLYLPRIIVPADWERAGILMAQTLQARQSVKDEGYASAVLDIPDVRAAMHGRDMVYLFDQGPDLLTFSHVDGQVRQHEVYYRLARAGPHYFAALWFSPSPELVSNVTPAATGYGMVEYGWTGGPPMAQHNVPRAMGPAYGATGKVPGGGLMTEDEVQYKMAAGGSPPAHPGQYFAR